MLLPDLKPEIPQTTNITPPTSTELLARVGNYDHPSQALLYRLIGQRMLNTCVHNGAGSVRFFEKVADVRAGQAADQI